jgi:sugar transferase (PEP-CTERM/EpsH1 system associated)
MGGLENGLINLINSMQPAAFRHAIACVEDYTDFRERVRRPDVEVFALRRSEVGVWSVRRQLFRLTRRLRPAILHSRAMSGLDALLPAWLAGVPHRVHGEHGWDVNDLHGKEWKPALLRRVHSPLVDRYITVSKHIQSYLIDRVGVDVARIDQIYNGVDTDRFAPATERRTDVLPSSFAAPDSVVIGTVGRLQKVKDQQTLVRAFAEIARRRDAIAERVRLVIVGDGPLRRELQALVESLGISAATWMPGAIANVREAMQSFDLFALPSLSEGISNTILEAMASGLPVVATSVGGNTELVEEGRSGRLFRPGDVSKLAELLTEYVADAEYRRAHALVARHRAVEQFSLEVMVQKYQAVYESLLAQR